MKKLYSLLFVIVALMMPRGVWADNEAYVVLSDDDTVLTFHYDGRKETNSGMSINRLNWFNKSGKIKKIIFEPLMSNCLTITNTSMWFHGLRNLTSIEGLEHLRTDNVTDMSCMFQYCSSLTSLDVSNFKTENVTDMSAMFSGCTNLATLNLSGLKNDNVTNMSQMFSGCSSLTSLNLSGFNTNSVTNMYGMFDGCSILTGLELGSFNTSNVTDMRFLFNGCSSLTSLDLGSFNTCNATDMSYMFQNCTSLTTIYVSRVGWNIEKVGYFNNTFYHCNSLVGGNGTHYQAAYNPRFYARIDRVYAPGYLTDIDNVYAALNEDNTTLTFYYDREMESRSGIGIASRGWKNQCASIKSVVFDESFTDCDFLTSTAYWFAGCNNLTSITGINRLKTEYVNDMRYMFQDCSGLTNLDVSNFNTENVVYMEGVFSGCSGLTSLDVSKFKTDNVTKMDLMFNLCSGLETITVSNFNTENVKSMYRMFGGCAKLTSLDLSNFNTSNVTSMMAMFDGCKGLKDLNLSSFNTSNVTSMQLMFDECASLTSIDLSNFNTENVKYMNNMFKGCSSLTNFDLSVFKIGETTKTDNMFNSCTSLKSINLGNSITKIEGATFRGCTSLASLVIPESVTRIEEYAFWNCQSLLGITIPNSVKTIGNHAFELCQSAEFVDIGNAVETIGERAFYGINNSTLAYICIPASVRSIGTNAFNWCFPHIIYSYIQEPFAVNMGVTSSVLYVPTGTKLKYEATEGWKTFPNIVEMGLDPVNQEVNVDFSEDITAQTNLDGRFFGDVFYSIGSDAGGYDSSDGSVVIGETTNMGQIGDATPGSSDIVNNFTGLILKVAAGKGTIKVNVKTTGNAQLVVQVGNQTPMIATKTEQGDVVVNYDVVEDTYVYIYAIIGSSAAPSQRVASDNVVKIYGITVTPGATGINDVERGTLNVERYYTLDGRKVDGVPAKKGIYIQNGRKIVVK